MADQRVKLSSGARMLSRAGAALGTCTGSLPPALPDPYASGHFLAENTPAGGIHLFRSRNSLRKNP